MKSLTISILMLTFPIFLISQNGFYLNTNSISENFSNADISNPWEYFWIDIFMGNDSEDTIFVNWEKIVNADCQLEWDTQISDKNNDYEPHFLMNTNPIDLLPNESEVLFRALVRPHSTAGCCDIAVVFSTDGDPSIVLDTAYFHFQINQEDCMITGLETLENSEINIFPNPVNETLFISPEINISQVNIYFSDGKIALKSKSIIGNQINMNHLSSGLYIIEILEKSGSIFTKKVLKK